MPIKHAFTSAKADGGDATLVRPSDWNADHDAGTLAEVLTAGGDPEGNPITGQVEIRPQATDLYGVLIQALADFYDNYNAFIRVLDENGVEIFNLDSGGFDMVARSGEATHVALIAGNARSDLSSLTGLALTDATGLNFANLNMQQGLQLAAFVPALTPGVSKLQFYYDDTNGAAKLKFRGKSADGTVVTGEVALT